MSTEKFAIIKAGGHQYKVTEGMKLTIDELDGGVLPTGESVTFSDIVLAGSGDDTKVGAPYISGASVSATVTAIKKAPKVMLFKKRRRQGYTKKEGHRQQQVELTINSISL